MGQQCRYDPVSYTHLLNHEYIEHNGTYWNVCLYSQDGSEMYTMGVNGDITSQRSCRVGLPAGTYYVKVREGTFHSDVNYNLRVNYVAADFWEREDNDNRNASDSISANKSVTGLSLIHIYSSITFIGNC